MQLYIHTHTHEQTHMHVCTRTYKHICPVHQHIQVTYITYMSKLPDYQCTAGLLAVVMVQLLRNQRTHSNNSSYM